MPTDNTETEEQQHECEDCGCALSADDVVTRAEREVCEDCASDNYTSCIHCGCVVSNDDIGGSDDDGDSVCSACLEAHYEYSEPMDCYVRTASLLRASDTENVASYRYASNHWYWSEATEEWYEHEESLPEEKEESAVFDYGEDVLEHCRWDRRNARNALVFGVELEIEPQSDSSQSDLADALGGRENERYILKSDGSLNDGVELVTVPLTLEQHKADLDWKGTLAPVARIGKSGMGTTNCGMHVHINKAALSPLQIGKMLVFLNSDAMDEHIVRIAQRGSNGYCAKKKASIIDGKNGNYNRYERANITSRTVEIRIFRGNLRPERVLKNLEFCHALVTYTRDCSMQMLESWEAFASWLLSRRGQYPNLVRFLAEAKAPRFVGVVKPKKQTSLVREAA